MYRKIYEKGIKYFAKAYRAESNLRRINLEF